MSQLKTNSITNIGNTGDDNITLNSDGSTDFNGDITADNWPTNGSVVGYQQGLWTPTPSQGEITTVNARWSRIGNQVTIQANLRGFTNTSSDDEINITGIPYARVEDLFAIGSMRTGCLNYGEGRNLESCLMISNEIRVGISIASVDTTAAPAANYVKYTSFITASAADTQLVFTLTYFTDDTTWTPINGATLT